MDRPGPDDKVVTRGTHRVRSLEDTWKAIEPRLADMGITRVANVTGLDDVGIPVVMVCRPNALTLSVSQGKGLTLEAARVSGVMEAVEFFHAEELAAPSPRVSVRELSSPGAIVDVGGLPLHAATPLDPARPTAWVEGRDLASGDSCWVPYEYVQLGRVPAERRTFANTSSGLAAGNSLPEACSHAICELVERHALSIWIAMPGELRAATRVELASITDEACRSLLERLAGAGVAVGVWDITGEVRIPAFACYIAPRTQTPRFLQPAAGFGCHPSREVALARAITEAAQSRLTHIAGARDDLTGAQYHEATRSSFVRHVLDFIEAGAPRPFDSAPTRYERGVSADVEWELGRLAEAHMPCAVAVDLTRSELGIPVVRVVIPGLELPGFKLARTVAIP